MKSTVNDLLEKSKKPVGVYYNLEASVTNIGPVPKGLEQGGVAWTTTGDRLILRDVVQPGTELAYNFQYDVCDVSKKEVERADEDYEAMKAAVSPEEEQPSTDEEE